MFVNIFVKKFGKTEEFGEFQIIAEVFTKTYFPETKFTNFLRLYGMLKQLTTCSKILL
jgi:hypothetical protein